MSRSDWASSPSYLFISTSVVSGRHEPSRATSPADAAPADRLRRRAAADQVEPRTLIQPKSATRDTLQKLVAEILAAWRRAERLASTLPAESPEHEAAQRACNRLRDAYQELTHSGVAEALTAAEAKMLLRDAASDVDP